MKLARKVLLMYLSIVVSVACSVVNSVEETQQHQLEREAPVATLVQTTEEAHEAYDLDTLSNDLIFIPDPGIRIEMASQPAPVIAEDGTIYIFYSAKTALPNEPSSEAVAISSDGLNFTEIGLDPTSVSQINPFATQMANGVWKLFPINQETGEMTSLSSQDGVHFTADSGVRYTVPPEHMPIGVRDFYVNTSGEVIFLYVAPIGIDSPDHHIRRAVSKDNGETFEFHSDNVLGDRGGGKLNTHLDPKFTELPDGSVRLITMVQGNVVVPGQRTCCEIYSFTSPDGYTFTQDPGIRLQTGDFEDMTVWSLNDPWMIQLPDGRYRLYVAGLVKTDTPGQPMWAILSATTP